MSLGTELSDDDLIREIRVGNVNAYGTLIERHCSRLRAFIALRVPLPGVIDELSHETFVFAYRNLDRFAPGSSFSAWIAAISLQLLRAEQQRFRRHEIRQARYADHVLFEGGIKTVGDSAAPEMESLERCVQRLPARSRELVDLRYHFSLSAEEISERVQQSVAWVRTTLFRVRQQLRHCVEQLQPNR